MGSISSMKEPYNAAMESKWVEMVEWFKKDNNGSKLASSMTVAKGNAFHVAVYSGDKEPLKALIGIAEKQEDPQIKHAYKIKNAYGNTALHQAIANIGNYKAVKLLVKYNSCRNSYQTGVEQEEEDLLRLRNHSGETPLLTAAAYGYTEIVEFLARQPGQMTRDNKLIDIHRYRMKQTGVTPQNSILHEAIEGEHFETALLLLKLDESLAELKNNYNMTGLELLANMPSAFKSGYPMGILKSLFYTCLPDDDTDQNHDIDNVKEGVSPKDLESGQSKNKNSKLSCIHEGRKKICLLIWRFFSRACPWLDDISKEKKKHNCASKLAQILIKKDTTWEESVTEDSSPELRRFLREEVSARGEAERSQNKETQKQKQKMETPLFAATRNGIKEIVNEILRVHPQAVGHTSELGQNILHLAIKYRQKEIFSTVTMMKIPMYTMVRAIDIDHYTVLHHAALMDGHTGGAGATHRSGPVFRLQDELGWFRRVKELLPTHFAMHHDKEDRTAKALFEKEHKDLHAEAKKWIKGTSQSCSALSALIAGFVFAAAYQLPGGTDDKGFPHFQGKPLFNIFAIMDVVSLASSLTSLVMFLSILSSPFELENFSKSLPRKLTFAFAMLFFSVATTLLAFAATLLLISRLEARNLTLTLIYTAAFLPVCLLGMTQLPLYVAFKETLMGTFRIIRKSRPLKFGFRLFLKKN